ncbi:MAG: hypothetical protein WB622_15385, partial [Acidobacteriaceae bacterium]
PGERTPSIAGNTVTLPLPAVAPEVPVIEMPVPGVFAFEPQELQPHRGSSLGTPAEGGALA